MTEQEAFSLHMAKVNVTQARAFRLNAKKNGLGWSFVNGWHSFLLAYAEKCRARYLSCLCRDKEPPKGQLEMF